MGLLRKINLKVDINMIVLIRMNEIKEFILYKFDLIVTYTLYYSSILNLSISMEKAN